MNIFRFRMPDPSIEDDDCRKIITYATKHLNDSYLKNRNRKIFYDSQQNYADDSRLSQMIRSTDFLSAKSPCEVKKIRNRSRRRYR